MPTLPALLGIAHLIYDPAERFGMHRRSPLPHCSGQKQAHDPGQYSTRHSEPDLGRPVLKADWMCEAGMCKASSPPLLATRLFACQGCLLGTIVCLSHLARAFHILITAVVYLFSPKFNTYFRCPRCPHLRLRRVFSPFCSGRACRLSRVRCGGRWTASNALRYTYASAECSCSSYRLLELVG